METILKSELDKTIELNEVEAFTPQQLKDYAEQAVNEIQKSNESKENVYAEVASEIRSFKPMMVWDDKTLQKSIMMVRPAQIKWDTPTDDISKSRSGTYMNTPENKKLGRVGKKYGEKKEGKETEKIMDKLDEGWKEGFKFTPENSFYHRDDAKNGCTVYEELTDESGKKFIAESKVVGINQSAGTLNLKYKEGGTGYDIDMKSVFLKPLSEEHKSDKGTSYEHHTEKDYE